MKKLSTREIIVQTVREHLERKPIDAITVQEITRDIGISKRSFYNYFQDKFEACNAVYDDFLDTRCWYSDGERCSLKQFFENLSREISGDYARFFENTMCYSGQNNITEYIVTRGVQDLKEQLCFTGHEEMVTAENCALMEFYMRGLAATLHSFTVSDRARRESLALLDKTNYLPQELYEALTAPVNSSVLESNERKE